MKAILALTAAITVATPVMAFATDTCPDVPKDQWMSETAITEKAAAMGYAVQSVETDDGCYEVKATDQAGKLFEIEFHPGTGDVIELEAEDGDQDDKDDDNG